MDATNSEWIEVIVYCVVCTIVILLFLSPVLRDMRRSISSSVVAGGNDDYILMAVKIWSGIFIALVAILLLVSRVTLPLLQLNLFLVISLSGLMVDQMPLFPYLFVFTSAVSWYDIYFAFMNSSSGISVARLLEPKWIVAFYAMTSCVISGHLKERLSVLNWRTSAFQLSCVVFVFALSLPVEYFCNTISVNASEACSQWNKLPIRMEEMEVGFAHRIICIVFMTFLHVGTRFLILSADTEPVVDAKKTDDMSPEDTPTITTSSPSGRKSSPYHRYANLPSDIEGDNDANGVADRSGELSGELPADCVEVSEEEACRLVEGPHFSGTPSSSGSRSGMSQRTKPSA